MQNWLQWYVSFVSRIAACSDQMTQWPAFLPLHLRNDRDRPLITQWKKVPQQEYPWFADKSLPEDNCDIDWQCSFQINNWYLLKVGLTDLARINPYLLKCFWTSKMKLAQVPEFGWRRRWGSGLCLPFHWLKLATNWHTRMLSLKVLYLSARRYDTSCWRQTNNASPPYNCSRHELLDAQHMMPFFFLEKVSPVMLTFVLEDDGGCFWQGPWLFRNYRRILRVHGASQKNDDSSMPPKVVGLTN